MDVHAGRQPEADPKQSHFVAHGGPHFLQKAGVPGLGQHGSNGKCSAVLVVPGAARVVLAAGQKAVFKALFQRRDQRLPFLGEIAAGQPQAGGPADFLGFAGRPGHAHPGGPQLAFVVFVPLAHTEPHQRIIIQLRGDCKGFFGVGVGVRTRAGGAEQQARADRQDGQPLLQEFFFQRAALFQAVLHSGRKPVLRCVRPAERNLFQYLPLFQLYAANQAAALQRVSQPKAIGFGVQYPAARLRIKRGESIGRKFQCKCLFLPGRQQAGFGKGDQPAVFFWLQGAGTGGVELHHLFCAPAVPGVLHGAVQHKPGPVSPFQAQAAGLDGKLRVGKAISKSKSNRYVKGVKVAVSHKNPLMVPNGAGVRGRLLHTGAVLQPQRPAVGEPPAGGHGAAQHIGQGVSAFHAGL